MWIALFSVEKSGTRVESVRSSSSASKQHGINCNSFVASVFLVWLGLGLEMVIERGEPSDFEPTVGDQLRLAQLVKAAEKADKEELLEMVKLLGHQVFIHYPCATRYLAKEAARNLAGVNVWSEKESKEFPV